MIDAFEYWLYKSVFFAVLWLLLSPLCLAMMYVLDLLGGKDAPLFVRVPLIIGLLVALVGTHWVASTAAKKRVVGRVSLLPWAWQHSRGTPPASCTARTLWGATRKTGH